jgi:hypothetical protein
VAFVTPLQVQTAIAARLKLTDITKVPGATVNAIPDAIDRGYQEIVSKLLGRGYTMTQIVAWDRAAEFNRDLAMFWCAVQSANLDASDLWVQKLDRRKELDTVAITIGGVLVNPGTSGGGQVGFGTLDTTNDIVTRTSRTNLVDRATGRTRW